MQDSREVGHLVATCETKAHDKTETKEGIVLESVVIDVAVGKGQ